MLAIVHSIKLWRHYLEGHEFQVITDHQSLTYFQTQPTFSKRQARWNEIIQGHDYKIIYKPGAQNILADGLSRRVDHLNTITIVTRSALAKKIREASKTAISTQKFSKDYHIEKGIIYHRTQIYIPEDKHLRVEILQENHDHTYSGHLGVDKTYNLILKDYY